MADFAPPSGPPPPKVPEGWKAIWNDQYKEWFYVNIHTKQSQWDKPDAPAVDPNASHDAAPPSYSHGGSAPANAGIDSKSSHLQSNNPYGSNAGESDEALARRLQEEENARNGGGASRGANDAYYGGAAQNQQYPNSPSYNNPSLQSSHNSGPSTDRGSGKSGGFLSKIKDKISQPPQQRHGGMGGPMMGYNAGGYPSQGQRYGGQQYGGYPQQGYGQPMGYGHQQMGYGHPVKKKGGLGAGGAAALGVGGGLVGGMLLADGIDDMQDDAYDQGYDDGGGDMGGDMDGGDF